MATTRRERVIAPLRRDLPKLLRVHRALGRIAGWSWRFLLVAFVLVLATHVFRTPVWSRVVAHVLVAALFLLLFCSNGLALAATSILIQRKHSAIERVGLVSGVLGGI